MITPELRQKMEEEDALKELVRQGISLQMSGAISRTEAKRYWLCQLPNLPIEIVAEVLAYHLPTTQSTEHALMKSLLSRHPKAPQ